MTLRPNARPVRAAGAGALVLASSLAAAACGSQSTPPPQRHSAGPCAAQIAQLARQSAAGTSTFAGGVTLVAAARLSAKVEVVVAPNSFGPACTVLQPERTLVLWPGQKAVFEANAAPSMSGTTTAVSISEAPGVSAPPPLQTPHVIVTVTAVDAGTVTLAWTNCSGTGC
jgi:hypothetical protein